MALNDRQKRFCEEYIIDLNATAAYLRAGYKCSRAAAADSAYLLLRNPDVQVYLGELQTSVRERNEITVDRVITEVAVIAFGDISQVVDVSGGRIYVKDFSEIDPTALKAIKSVTCTETEELTKTTVTMIDKVKGLSLLCQILGFTSDFNTAIATFKKYGLTIWQDNDGWHVKDSQAQSK